MGKRGPAARNAINPEAFVNFVDSHSIYHVEGFPRRRRRYFHGKEVHRDHRRMLTRWFNGTIEGIAPQSARRFLAYYGLTTEAYVSWCQDNGIAPMIRGEITA